MHPYICKTTLTRVKGLNSKYPYFLNTMYYDTTQNNKFVKSEHQALTKQEVDQFKRELTQEDS